MKTDKKTREDLRFDVANNMWPGRYETDWDTGIKYIRPRHGVTVNEGGVIYLTTDLFRKPDERVALDRELGIDIRDVAGLPTLYEPGTNRKITKRSLRGTNYLVDREHDRVLCIDERHDISGVSACASWIVVDSPATSYTMLKTKERNFAAEAKWKQEHAEDMQKAQAVYALEDTQRFFDAATLVQQLRGHFKGADKREDFYSILGQLMYNNMDAFNELVVDLTADYREYPHLTTKPYGL